jgi:hypothetical protein
MSRPIMLKLRQKIASILADEVEALELEVGVEVEVVLEVVVRAWSSKVLRVMVARLSDTVLSAG